MKNYKWVIALMIAGIVLSLFTITLNIVSNLLYTLEVLNHTTRIVSMCASSVLGMLCGTFCAIAFGLGALRLGSGRKERLPLLLMALGEAGCVVTDLGWLIYNIVFATSYHDYSEYMIGANIALQALYYIMVAIFIVAAIWLAVVNKSTLMRIGATLYAIGKMSILLFSLVALPIIINYIDEIDSERWFLRVIYPFAMGFWHFIVTLCLYVPIIAMVRKAGKSCTA